MSDDDAPEKELGPSVPAGAVSRELQIINKRGLHARASAKFVQMVEKFNAEVWVTRGSETVGGTPSNLAISCMSRPKVEVLAGINLPMLVKLAKVRENRSLPEAVDMAQEAGRKYVTIASSVLAGK